MPTLEEREIEARLLRQVPGRLAMLPMAELVESARWYLAGRNAAMGRALFHIRAGRSAPDAVGKVRHERAAWLLLGRADSSYRAAAAHLDLIEDRRPDRARSLADEFCRSFRRAKRRAAAQAFFHRHPRLRSLRRYFLGRKAVLRWA